MAIVMLTLALVGLSCGNSGGSGRSLTVGSTNFTENVILANLYAKALEAKSYRVRLRANLGNREVVQPAIEKGEIDLYPDYAATELEFLKPGAGEASPDIGQTMTKLNGRLRPKGLEALTPAPAVDTDAFAVTKATAEKYGLRKLSDLAPLTSRWTFGGPPECPVRSYCLMGLERVYGIKFKTFRALDVGGTLTKTALEKGDIDVGLVLSSDGSILAKDFVVLQDDRHLQNADNVVPVIRSDKATPEVRTVLDAVSAKLGTEDLVKLNKQSQLDKDDPDRVAEAWLKEKGLA